MLHWLNQNAAAVQALAAVAVALLTIALVVVTGVYARITRGALQLSRQQFEKQWKPDLRIMATPELPQGRVKLEMFNMAIHSALVTHLVLEFGEGNGARSGQHTFKHLVPGYGSREAEISNLVLHSARTLHKDLVDTETVDRREFALRISVRYCCAGETSDSPSISCRLWISKGKLEGMGCKP